jgi:hypothetical protein
VANLLKDSHLPYTVVEDPVRKTVAIKSHSGDLYSAEALVVSLDYTCGQQLLSAAIRQGCTDAPAVLVPASYGFDPHERC